MGAPHCRAKRSTVPPFHKRHRFSCLPGESTRGAVPERLPCGAARQQPWTEQLSDLGPFPGRRPVESCERLGKCWEKPWWNHDFYTWKHGENPWFFTVKKWRRSGEKGWGMNDVKWWVTVRWCNRIFMDIYREFMIYTYTVYVYIICLPNCLKVNFVCHMFRDTQWLHHISQTSSWGTISHWNWIVDY